MKTHLLLNKLEEVINLASDLSTSEHDNYARCVESLLTAKEYIVRINIHNKSNSHE